ncbi:MAG TPA: vitamin K epoxide reductase family protein [Candidatus Limnocylindrales bacterium]|nr:vitamin K epoxide reductase family protein [Candidatus Limnocylindrales bacterium]
MHVLLCACGVGIAATILYVHGQIDKLGSGYTSFCTVNESISCDKVLSSSYSRIGGLPVAWLALLAYLGLASLFAGAARTSDDRTRRTLVGLAAAGVIGALTFSAYMAVIAAVRLETLCLLCAGLYTVATVNAGVLTLTGRRMSAAGEAPLTITSAAAIFAASVASVVVLGLLTWPHTTTALSSDIRTAADVKEADPEFYAWFTGLPKVDVASLLREDQTAALSSGKVVLVDFFDLECAHCLRSYHMIRELAARRGQAIEIVHRHFPLDAACNDIVTESVHTYACRAAEAAECAGLQGKRDEMIDILFKNQTQLFAENLPRLAGKIGLDKDALERCLDEHRTLPTVLADARAGARLDIKSTPTLFLGGRRITGVLDEVRKYEMAVLIASGGDAAPSGTRP